MARSIPKAHDGSLHQHTAGGTSLDPIMIGTAAWYSWLEQHRSFRFEAGRMTFTARKEQRPGATIGMRTDAAMASCIPPTSVSQKN